MLWGIFGLKKGIFYRISSYIKAGWIGSWCIGLLVYRWGNLGEEENQIKAECFYLSKEKGVKAYKTVLSVDGRSEENIKWEEVNEKKIKK